MEDRQHTARECADKSIPEIICFRKKFDQVSMHTPLYNFLNKKYRTGTF